MSDSKLAGWLAHSADGRARLLRGSAGLLRDTLVSLRINHTSLVAAGCAFWGTLALFPGLSMLVSVYGLVFNPRNVVRHLGALSSLLPPDVYFLIASRLEVLVRHRMPALSTGLALGALVTFWSTANGVKSLLAALNLAYRETEARGFLRFQLVAVVMTIGAILAAAVGMALLVAVPLVFHMLGMAPGRRVLLHSLSSLVLLVTVMGALLVLYRFGPSRRGHWHLATPGAMAATLLWLAASELFSWYVGYIAPSHATYGPLATAAGVLMWFYVTAYTVLFGAELNAQVERRVGR